MTHFGYTEISELLGVGAPLLWLDSLEVNEAEGNAVGVVQITMNHPVFQGHFPGNPILPGVLQVAAMEQATRVLAAALKPDAKLRVASLHRMKFRRQVQPGMTLRVVTEVAGGEEGTLLFKAKCLVGEEVASNGQLVLAPCEEKWLTPELNLGEPPFAATCEGKPLVGPIALSSYLPHRYPFMLLDGVYGFEDVSYEIGYKNITGGDPLVQACTPLEFPHFLQIEACAQLGCAILLKQPENVGLLGVFMSVDDAEIMRPILPGERAWLELRIESRGKYGIAEGACFAGSSPALKMSLKFALINPLDNNNR